VLVAVAIGVVVVLGAGIALASCSGGGDDKASSNTTSAPRTTTVDLTVGDVSADSAGPAVTISPDQSQAVLDVLTTYVKGAMVEPLRSGQPATADFGAVFDPTTLASATTTDRGVLFDEGLPKVTGDLTVTAPPVTLVGLGDQTGNLTLVTASLGVDAKGVTKAKGGPLHVVRKAAFTLQPDPSGAWKITAYDVSVLREGADVSSASTSAASTTGAAR
jgi:hypothetical protein